MRFIAYIEVIAPKTNVVILKIQRIGETMNDVYVGVYVEIKIFRRKTCLFFNPNVTILLSYLVKGQLKNNNY